MKFLMRAIDIILDIFKKSLVRFKDAKFGIMFIVNLFKLPDFFTDKEVSIISKSKVAFIIFIALIYLVSGIDFIPEMITGVFGFIDDLFIIFWSLGIVSEEIEKYKKIKKESYDPNIIEGVAFSIRDEE